MSERKPYFLRSRSNIFTNTDTEGRDIMVLGKNIEDDSSKRSFHRRSMDDMYSAFPYQIAFRQVTFYYCILCMNLQVDKKVFHT
jgi:hypothetical protein